MTILLLLVAGLQSSTLDAAAGFQGDVFPDAWTRISSTVTYEGEPLDAELQITVHAYSIEPVVYRRPLRLVRKARMRLGTDVFLTGRESRVDVELVAGGRTLRSVPLTPNFVREYRVRLLAVGTPPPFLLDALGRRPPVTLVRLAPELLPSTALSLLSLDAIVIPEPIDLDPGQESALQSWVAQGGRLIFGAGRSTHLRQNPFWRDWCPLASPEIATASVRWKESDLPVTLVRGKLLRGRASSPLGGDPAVIRFREGAGEIVFMPVLLDQPNLGRVLGGAALLADLLDLPPPPVENLTPRRGIPRFPEWVPRNQKSEIPEETVNFMRRILPAEFTFAVGPLALGVGVIVVYIVLMGPVEFLRLRRKGQLRKGWRSFGILVLVFGGIVLVWGQLISPRASRLVLITLRDEQQVHTFGVLRPARGGHYEMESSGANTPLSPGLPFGVKHGEKLSVLLPSSLSLPTPPSASRLLVSARPVEAADGSITAQWTTPEKRSLTVKSSAPYPLTECWAVAKDAVWPVVGEIPAASSSTIDLKTPISFLAWASQEHFMFKKDESAWWRYESSWRPVSPSRCGLVLSFNESLNEAWDPRRSRRPILERGIDLSPALEKGEVVLVGLFDRNLSAIRTRPEIPAETFGWARIRVREANR